MAMARFPLHSTLFARTEDHVSDSRDGADGSDQDFVNGGEIRAVSPDVLVSGLGDGLPDAPDESSGDDNNDDDDDGQNESIKPSFGNTNIPHGSAEESAAFLTNFAVPAAKNVPGLSLPSSKGPSRVLKTTKPISGLKTLLQRGGLYKGVHPSSGVQRVMRPIPRQTDDDGQSISPILPQRMGRAASVDPASLNMQVQDTISTAPTKRRKLNSRIASAHVSEYGTAAIAGPVHVKKASVLAIDSPGFPQVEEILPAKRKRGRPPKPKVSEDGILRHTAARGEEPAVGSRPDEGSEQHREPIAPPTPTSHPVNIGPKTTTGKKRGRPRKSVAVDAGGNGDVEVRIEAPRSRASRGAVVDSDESVRRDKQTSPDNEPTGQMQITEEPQPSRSPSSAQSSDEPRDGTIRDGPILVEDSPESVDSPEAVDAPESGDAPEAEDANDSSPTQSQFEPEEQVDENDSAPDEHNEAVEEAVNDSDSASDGPGEVVEEDTAKTDEDPLTTAFKCAKRIGQKRVRGTIIKCKLPKIKTAAAIKVQHACGAAKQCVSKREEAAEAESAGNTGSEENAESEENAGSPELQLMRAVTDVQESALQLIQEEDWKNSRAVRDVYVHVIPKMTLLLRDVLRLYHIEAADQLLSNQQLSREQLNVFGGLMFAITKVGSTLKGDKTKLTLKFPIKTTVGEILKHISKAYRLVNVRLKAIEKKEQEERAKLRAEQAAERKALEKAEAAVAYAERERRESVERNRIASARRAHDEKQRRLRADQEAAAQAQRKLLLDWTHEWSDLHTARMQAELHGRCFIDRSKRQLLRTVPLQVNYEYRAEPEFDANGDEIERVQMFSQRKTQPPGSFGRKQSYLTWDAEESYELMSCLRKYSGPHMYHHVIRQLCRADGPLNDRTVSEIVDQAVWLRDQLVKRNREEGVETEDWTLSIFDPRTPPEGLTMEQEEEEEEEEEQ